MTWGVSSYPNAMFETSPVCGFGEVSNDSVHRQISVNPPRTPFGPALAINRLHLGGADLSRSTAKRGGARNRSSRESETLTKAHVANLIAASGHAARIGLPFTRMITIHWEAAGVALSGLAKATGRFVDLMSKALCRHGHGSAWLWVHEGGRTKGGHCHLLAHIPAAFVKRLTRLQMSWLRLITGRPYKTNVIFSEPIGGRLGLEAGNPALHAANLQAALGYVLKGACPATAKLFRLERIESGGLIIGKRCSTSQNIGRKCREAKA